MRWNADNTITVDPPKNPLKLTGTRFAAIFGLNAWTTPFKVWAEITRTYKEPFEETIYTKAGKIIEPKQAQYVKTACFVPGLVTPTEEFGKDYFKFMRGDFFHDNPVLGGMWDFLEKDENGKVVTVFEMKTTKRSEDWADDIPEYYALQAALYAYLLGCETVCMVASFLEESDYEDPDSYICSPKNTITRTFNLHDRYPHFEIDYVEPAEEWWRDHVLSGISPVYDEKRDADILKELRKNHPQTDDDICKAITRIEELSTKLEEIDARTAPFRKELEDLKKAVKAYAMTQFRDGDDTVSINGRDYTFDLKRSSAFDIDRDAMRADGVLDKYNTVEKTSYRFTINKKKEVK